MQVTDPRTPAQPRSVPRLPLLKALTSIRFFAALHVALYHFVRPFELWGWLAPVMRVGYVGVSFFFLLSGYILTYSHAAEYESGKGNVKRFWVARFARIYPVYLLSMLAAAYVNLGQFHERKHILAYIADLLMVQSWSVRLVPFFHTTAWSLSVEAFFYLVFPFVLLRLQPRSAKAGCAAVIGFWALAMLIPAASLYVFPSAAWSVDSPASLRGALYLFALRRIPVFALPEFLAGISLAWIFLHFKPHPRFSPWLALAGILGVLLSLFASDHLPGVMLHNGLLIPFFALLILGISYPNRISKFLTAPWLMLLGEASYSLYLVHFLFNGFVDSHFKAGDTLLDAAWKLAIVIPLSIALHLFVERPGRRLVLYWWARHSQGGPAQTAAVQS